MKVDNYIQRVKTLNTYISLMKLGAVKWTEGELMEQFDLKGVPIKWMLDLKVV